MSWLVDQRIVAEPTGAMVGGTSAADGCHVHVDIAFRLVEWPWEEKGPVSLVAQPSDVTARVERGEIRLGFATPAPNSAIIPPGHSSTVTIRFTLQLSTRALTALEAIRNGGTLELVMTLVAHPVFVSQLPGYAPGVTIRPTSENYVVKVPKEQWIAVLKNVGYCDTLITELRLLTSGPDAAVQGRQRLVQAVAARNDGSYAEAMRRCRIALDELKKAGFGGKAPQDVARFFQENAGAMSQAERFSALQTSLQLFLSPTHHANAPEEHYSREDAELAIAMTAALLKLAPQHAPPEEQPKAAPRSKRGS